MPPPQPEVQRRAPRAYSYLRFSRPEQGRGDSLRRQLALSEAYAAKHGVVLDDSLRMTDHGISAFRGRNATEGAFGEFLRNIKAGKIPRGSLLLVESLDRISRQQVLDALGTFLGIIEAGITIVTLSDDTAYSAESLRAGPIPLVMSLMLMTRAHEESAIKSSRLSAAWSAKRNNVEFRKLTAKAPAWLRLEFDRKQFTIVEERATVVRWLYEQTLRGVGKFRLAAALNGEGDLQCPGGPQAPWGEKGRKGRKWHSSYVEKILTNPAVVGLYQPHHMVEGRRVPIGEPILDYFPPVVERGVYDSVRALKGKVQGVRGRIGSLSNLFTGIAICAYTDTPCTYHNKGKWRYLKSGARRIAETGRRIHGWPYSDFELHFLQAVGRLDLNEVFGVADEQMVAINQAAASAEEALKDLDVQIDNLTAVAMEGVSAGRTPASIVAKLNELEQARPKLAAAARSASRALEDALNAGSDAIASALSIRELINQRSNPEVRHRLRREIRKIVERIEVSFRVEGEDELPWIVVRFRNGVTRFTGIGNRIVVERDQSGRGHLIKVPPL